MKDYVSALETVRCISVHIKIYVYKKKKAVIT